MEHLDPKMVIALFVLLLIFGTLQAITFWVKGKRHQQAEALGDGPDIESVDVAGGSVVVEQALPGEKPEEEIK